MNTQNMVDEDVDAFVEDRVDNQRPTNMIEVEVSSIERVDMSNHRSRGDDVEDMDTIDRNEIEYAKIVKQQRLSKNTVNPLHTLRKIESKHKWTTSKSARSKKQTEKQ